MRFSHSTNMTRPVSKNPRISGATFIEALVVTAVIAGVIAAMGSSFTMGLRSYVSEYTSEARQIEVQRAYAELQYFGGKSSWFVEDGDTVTFYYADGSSVAFMFHQTGMFEGSRKGALSIVGPWGQYWYGVNVLADPVVKPFATAHGGCSFTFTVQSAGGDVQLVGLVYPSLVL